MLGTAEAVSHGAITIINAMATGRGAALGIELQTRATVTVSNRPGVFVARNLSDPGENTDLAKVTAQDVFERFRANKRFGAVIETRSNIPIAVGLKSSSAASNAVALASLHALGRKASDLEVVRLGVRASLKAGVTITGAFDDACACYFGGVIITDNVKRRILKRFRPRGDFRVLIHVPKMKRYTRDVDADSFRPIRPFIKAAHHRAIKGDYWNAMTLNGLMYSIALGYDTIATTMALESGAVAAGLTGKGPAVAAIVPDSKKDNVRAVWRRIKGQVIETSFNFRKATAQWLPP
ncbi:MAG TPA: shikimate kinase [Candidatus Dormibacteraeota bacterium]|nr:shikimate kinase [Candidatus Dormibacteraeota bacterium]